MIARGGNRQVEEDEERMEEVKREMVHYHSLQCKLEGLTSVMKEYKGLKFFEVEGMPLTSRVKGMQS